MADELSTKRIINLPAESEPEEGDVFVVDNESTGTKKLPIVGLIDTTLTKHGYAADSFTSGRLKGDSKNLLDPYKNKHSAVVSTMAKDNGLTVQNVSASSYGSAYIDLVLKPNTTYTFSAKKSVTAGRGVVDYLESTNQGASYPSSATKILIKNADIENVIIPVTFTTESGYIRIRFFSTYGVSDFGNVTYSDVMLEEGNIKTQFEPSLYARDINARHNISNLISVNEKIEKIIQQNGCIELDVDWIKGLSPAAYQGSQNVARHAIIEVPKDGFVFSGKGHSYTEDYNVTIQYKYMETRAGFDTNYAVSYGGTLYFPYISETPYLYISYCFRNKDTGVTITDANTNANIDDVFTPMLLTGSFIASQSYVPPLKVTSATRYKANNDPTSLDYDAFSGYYGYRLLSTMLPLENIDYIAFAPSFGGWVFVYKYDPVADTREYIGVEGAGYISQSRQIHLAPAGSNFIDLSEYGANYYGIVCVSTATYYLNEERKTGATARVGKWPNTLGLLPSTDAIYIKWKKDVVQHVAPYGNMTIQKNIKFLESIAVKRPFNARSPKDTTSQTTFPPVIGNNKFSGALYGGTAHCGSLWFHVSPQAYYTALQNPNSVAYSLYANEGAFYSRYGLVCSSFDSLLLGCKMPATTADFRFNHEQFPEFTTRSFSFNTEIYSVNRFDIIIQGYKDSGHCVLVNDIVNIDNVPYIEVYEAVTPCTERNCFVISNGTPFLHPNNEGFFHQAYDFITTINPEAVGIISQSSNWDIPYTDCSWKIANHRGYGSLYIDGNTRCYISCVDTDIEFVLKKGDTTIGTYSVSDLSPALENGYYVCEITSLLDGVGEYSLLIDGEVADKFYVISPTAPTMTVDVNTETNKVTISVDDATDIKYASVRYSLHTDATGTNMMAFAWPEGENVLEIPLDITIPDGYWRFAGYGHADIGNYINVVCDSGIDDQTYFFDGLGVVGV